MEREDCCKDEIYNFVEDNPGKTICSVTHHILTRNPGVKYWKPEVRDWIQDLLSWGTIVQKPGKIPKCEGSIRLYIKGAF